MIFSKAYLKMLENNENEVNSWPEHKFLGSSSLISKETIKQIERNRMRESKVENALKKRIKRQGGIPYKFTSPGKRGVPDELILMPVPEEYRAIVHKYVYFVECKAPGKKPRAEQVKVHKEMRKLGHRVDVIDSI